MNSLLLFRRILQQGSSMRSLNSTSTRFTSSSEIKDSSEPSSIDPQFQNKIDNFIKSNKITIFIKGEPDAPRMIEFFSVLNYCIFYNLGCGFSNAVLQILNLHGCDFKSKNILDDQHLRQAMKTYR